MTAAPEEPTEVKQKVSTLRGLCKGEIAILGDLTEPTFDEDPADEMLANWERLGNLS